MLSSPEEILKTLPLSDDNLLLLTEIFEVMPLQIAVKSLREECYGAFVIWNRGAELGLGIMSEEALGLTDADLFPADQAATLAENDRVVERTGEAAISCESVSSRNNGLRLRRSIRTPIFDADEKLVAILQVSEDITDHQGVTHAGGPVPGPLDKLFPGAVFHFRIDAEGRPGFPYISEGIRGLTGDETSDVMAGRANPFDRVISEDLSAFLTGIAKSRRELSPFRQEFRIRTKDEEIRWLSSTSLPRAESDGATLWEGFLTDVTRAKQSTDASARGEERLRSVLAGTKSAAWEVDLSNGELYLSREWGALFDFGRDAFPKTFDQWLTKFHLDDVEAVNGLRTSCVNGDEGREFRHLCGDGKYRRVLLRSQPVRNAEGRVLRLVGTITKDPESLPASVPKSVPAAPTSDGVKILAKMNHEIRNLLNAVIGFSEILATAPLEAEQLDQVLSIHENSTELLQILSDVLDYAKIEAGRLTPKPVPVNLEANLRLFVDTFQPEAHARNLILRVVTSNELPPSLLCDIALLNQILRKLLNNALKFTRVGSIEVEVLPDGPATRTHCPIAIRVQDTGPGIEAHRLPSIFDPLAESSPSNGKPGIDVGLALARRLCDLSGWTVGVESEVGKGTTFTLRLSLEIPPTDSAAIPANDAEHRSSLNLLDHPPKILVVDDNGTNRQLIRLLLRHLGHSADEAVNGFEGVEKAAAVDYDLIFMDLGMPGMDGFEATQRIRSGPHGATPMIVALIAHALAEHRERSLEAGMDAYLNKPVNKADLEKLLNGVPKSAIS
jgi:CheY-like chemotaxis protein/PAS domain-containing protein